MGGVRVMGVRTRQPGTSAARVRSDQWLGKLGRINGRLLTMRVFRCRSVVDMGESRGIRSGGLGPVWK